jgi:hypothetical protein
VVAVIVGAAVGFGQLAEDRSDARADRDKARADRELTRQGQASERFTRAINQLGDTQPVETRIGGIYGLAQVAEQAPDNNGPVGEVLLAWINHLPRPKPPPAARLSEHAPDVQAALTVLTQFDKNHDGSKDYAWLAFRLDLHALGLAGANLADAYLIGADLAGTDLHGADLARANLSGADLRDADLTDSYLTGANLTGANLTGANLTDAYLTGAYLTGATGAKPG